MSARVAVGFSPTCASRLAGQAVLSHARSAVTATDQTFLATVHRRGEYVLVELEEVVSRCVPGQLTLDPLTAIYAHGLAAIRIVEQIIDRRRERGLVVGRRIYRGAAAPTPALRPDRTTPMVLP